jgi:integrase
MHVTYIERSPGTWRVRIERGRDANGKRLFSWETVRGTKDDAARRRFEIMQAHEEGTFAAPDKLTLGKFLSRWVAQQLALQAIRRSTAENYETMFNAYVAPTLGSTRLQRVTGGDIQALYTRLLTEPRRERRPPLSLSSVAHLHRLLASAFKAARRAKLIKVNPMEEINPPRAVRAVPKALDEAGVRTLLDALKGDWRAPIVVAALVTGLRRGELLGLRWKDAELDASRLHVRGQLVEYKDGTLEWATPKTAKGLRAIAIGGELVAMLRRMRIEAGERRMLAGLGGGLDDAYVFTRDGVNPIRPDGFTKGFGELCDKIGLPQFTFHGTRHTHATELLRKVGKVGAKAVSQRLGHADITTTLGIYQRVFEDDDRELADLASGILGGRK